VSHRPLATVCGLTIGDYLLWNWSLNANHDVLSLISGLTLPPLAIAFVWLLVVTVARLLARTSTSSRRARSRSTREREPVQAPGRAAAPPARSAKPAREATPTGPAPATTGARASRKIAA